MTKTKKTKNRTTHRATTHNPTFHRQPLVEHLREVKRRVFYILIAVAAGSIAAYATERHLVEILLKPSNGQEFIYTSPLGGMNFLFGVCFQLGLVAATPVIIYNLLAFLRPLMRHATHRFLVISSMAATLTAAGGLVFGYVVGLPSALHFLLHQFTTVQVRPLITIQSYMSFVAVYLLGSALMFQLPLLILFINRIKPLKPSHLWKYERHMIVGSLIVAFIMNPTPNLLDQMLVVVPLIFMYQLSILMLWFIHRSDTQHMTLHEADKTRQAARLQPAAVDLPPPVPVSTPPATTVNPAPATRSIDGFVPARQNFQASYQRRLVQ